MGNKRFFCSFEILNNRAERSRGYPSHRFPPQNEITPEQVLRYNRDKRRGVLRDRYGPLCLVTWVLYFKSLKTNSTEPFFLFFDFYDKKRGFYISAAVMPITPDWIITATEIITPPIIRATATLPFLISANSSTPFVSLSRT